MSQSKNKYFRALHDLIVKICKTRNYSHREIELLHWRFTEYQDHYDANDDNLKEILDSSCRYIEIILKYSENEEGISNKMFKLNITKYMSAIAEIGSISKVANSFVEEKTSVIFEHITDPSIKISCAKELIRAYNQVIKSTDILVRLKLIDSGSTIHLYKLADILCACGDYEYQTFLLDTIFRMCTCDFIRTHAVDFFPETESLQHAFIKIDMKEFDYSLRIFLNIVNRVHRNTYSFLVDDIFLDEINVSPPMFADNKKEKLWIDFNMGTNTIGIYCDQVCLRSNSMSQTSESNSWELITIFANDVSLVEVKKPKFMKGETETPTLFRFTLTSPFHVQYPASESVTTSKFLKVLVFNSKVVNELQDLVLPNLFSDRFKGYQSVKARSKTNDSSKEIVFSRGIYKPLRVCRVSKSKTSRSIVSADTRSMKSLEDLVHVTKSTSENISNFNEQIVVSVTSTSPDSTMLDMSVNSVNLLPETQYFSAEEGLNESDQSLIVIEDNGTNDIENKRKSFDEEEQTAETQKNINKSRSLLDIENNEVGMNEDVRYQQKLIYQSVSVRAKKETPKKHIIKEKIKFKFPFIRQGTRKICHRRLPSPIQEASEASHSKESLCLDNDGETSIDTKNDQYNANGTQYISPDTISTQTSAAKMKSDDKIGTPRSKKTQNVINQSQEQIITSQLSNISVSILRNDAQQEESFKNDEEFIVHPSIENDEYQKLCTDILMDIEEELTRNNLCESPVLASVDSKQLAKIMSHEDITKMTAEEDDFRGFTRTDQEHIKNKNHIIDIEALHNTAKSKICLKGNRNTREETFVGDDVINEKPLNTDEIGVCSTAIKNIEPHTQLISEYDSREPISEKIDDNSTFVSENLIKVNDMSSDNLSEKVQELERQCSITHNRGIDIQDKVSNRTIYDKTENEISGNVDLTIISLTSEESFSNDVNEIAHYDSDVSSAVIGGAGCLGGNQREGIESPKENELSINGEKQESNLRNTTVQESCVDDNFITLQNKLFDDLFSFSTNQTSNNSNLVTQIISTAQSASQKESFQQLTTTQPLTRKKVTHSPESCVLHIKTLSNELDLTSEKGKETMLMEESILSKKLRGMPVKSSRPRNEKLVVSKSERYETPRDRFGLVNTRGRKKKSITTHEDNLLPAEDKNLEIEKIKDSEVHGQYIVSSEKGDRKTKIVATQEVISVVESKQLGQNEKMEKSKVESNQSEASVLEPQEDISTVRNLSNDNLSSKERKNEEFEEPPFRHRYKRKVKIVSTQEEKKCETSKEKFNLPRTRTRKKKNITTEKDGISHVGINELEIDKLTSFDENGNVKPEEKVVSLRKRGRKSKTVAIQEVNAPIVESKRFEKDLQYEKLEFSEEEKNNCETLVLPESRGRKRKRVASQEDNISNEDLQLNEEKLESQVGLKGENDVYRNGDKKLKVSETINPIIENDEQTNQDGKNLNAFEKGTSEISMKIEENSTSNIPIKKDVFKPTSTSQTTSNTEFDEQIENKSGAQKEDKSVQKKDLNTEMRHSSQTGTNKSLILITKELEEEIDIIDNSQKELHLSSQNDIRINDYSTCARENTLTRLIYDVDTEVVISSSQKSKNSDKGKLSQTDTKLFERHKKAKRRLMFDPNDLTYLENNFTVDDFNKTSQFERSINVERDMRKNETKNTIANEAIRTKSPSTRIRSKNKNWAKKAQQQKENDLNVANERFMSSIDANNEPEHCDTGDRKLDQNKTEINKQKENDLNVIEEIISANNESAQYDTAETKPEDKTDANEQNENDLNVIEEIISANNESGQCDTAETKPEDKTDVNVRKPGTEERVKGNGKPSSRKRKPFKKGKNINNKPGKKSSTLKKALDEFFASCNRNNISTEESRANKTIFDSFFGDVTNSTTYEEMHLSRKSKHAKNTKTDLKCTKRAGNDSVHKNANAYLRSDRPVGEHPKSKIKILENVLLQPANVQKEERDPNTLMESLPSDFQLMCNATEDSQAKPYSERLWNRLIEVHQLITDLLIETVPEGKENSEAYLAIIECKTKLLNIRSKL